MARDYGEDRPRRRTSCARGRATSRRRRRPIRPQIELTIRDANRQTVDISLRRSAGARGRRGAAGRGVSGSRRAGVGGAGARLERQHEAGCGRGHGGRAVVRGRAAGQGPLWRDDVRRQPVFAQDFGTDREAQPRGDRQVPGRGRHGAVRRAVREPDAAPQRAGPARDRGAHRRPRRKQSGHRRPASTHTLPQVLGAAEGRGRDGVRASGSAPKVDKDRIERVTQASGGEAYYPQDVSTLAAEYRRVLENLRRRYVISYTSTNSVRDGKLADGGSAIEARRASSSADRRGTSRPRSDVATLMRPSDEPLKPGLDCGVELRSPGLRAGHRHACRSGSVGPSAIRSRRAGDALAARDDPYSFTQDRAWLNHEWLSEIRDGGGVPGNGHARSQAAQGRDRRLQCRARLARVSRYGLAGEARRHGMAGIWRGTHDCDGASATLVVAVHHCHRPAVGGAEPARVLGIAAAVRALGQPARRMDRRPGNGGLWVAFGGVVEPGKRTHTWAMAGACVLATLATPYGARLWAFIWETVQFERAITEWRPLWEGASAGEWTAWIGTVAIGLLTMRASRGRDLARTAVLILLAVLAFRVMRIGIVVCGRRGRLCEPLGPSSLACPGSAARPAQRDSCGHRAGARPTRADVDRFHPDHHGIRLHCFRRAVGCRSCRDRGAAFGAAGPYRHRVRLGTGTPSGISARAFGCLSTAGAKRSTRRSTSSGTTRP